MNTSTDDTPDDLRKFWKQRQTDSDTQLFAGKYGIFLFVFGFILSIAIFCSRVTFPFVWY